MPERQTNVRIDTNEDNLWMEHYTHDAEGGEYEDSERITVRLTHNIALDALKLYNEFLRVQPTMTIADLKADLAHLEEIGYDEWNEEDAVHGHRRVEEKERGDDKDDSDEAAVVAK